MRDLLLLHFYGTLEMEKREESKQVMTPQLKVETYEDHNEGRGAAITPRGSVDYPKHHLSMAFVAFPFKKSTDGSIEQFIHTPALSPASDWWPGGDMDSLKGPRKSFNPSSIMESVMDSKRKYSADVKAMRLSSNQQMRRKMIVNKDSQVQFMGLNTLPLEIGFHQQSHSTTRLSSHHQNRGQSSAVGSLRDGLLNKRISCQSLSSVKTAASNRLSPPVMATRPHALSNFKYQPSPLQPLNKQSVRELESFLKKGLLLRHESLKRLNVGQLKNGQSSYSSLVSSLVTDATSSTKELREKFLYAIRMVRFMVRLTTCLKFYARNRKEDDEQSIEQLNYYSMEAEFTTEKLVFSKGNFAATNVIYVPPWAQLVLSKPPSERTDTEVTRLAAILKTVCSLKNFMEQKKLEDLCRSSTYARYEKQRILVKSGHRPIFAYLLMSGSVFVNIEEKNKINGKKFIRTAAVLEKGSLFGEIGVIHSVPRTATIIARENIECLVITADTCLRIFPEEINREFETRLQHMKKSGWFNGWPRKTLNDLCLVSKLLEYSYGTLIDKDTASSEFVYMVTKGRLEVLYQVTFSCKPKDIADGALSISDLLKHPPDHMFMPPLPAPAPPLLCGDKMATVLREGKGVLVSMESMSSYQCCDLLSLMKSAHSLPLILVSRGCEVIRIPKLRLQTIPSLKYWKVFLERARKTPSYPPDHVLARYYLEYSQWASYRKLVLQDVLKTKECFQVIPDGDTGRDHKPFDDKPDSAGSDRTFNKCLSFQGPLFDVERHQHKGPCLRNWIKGPINKTTPIDGLTRLSKRYTKALSQT